MLTSVLQGDIATPMSQGVIQVTVPAELPGDSKAPVELTSMEVPMPPKCTKGDSKESF